MIFSYIVVFTCIWWVIFYMALPFGVKKISPNKLGFDSGAPKNPYLGAKFTVTTIIAFILTWGVIYLIEHGHLTKFVDAYINFLSISF